MHAAASALPCEGATYGIGVVTVDGWAGYQGSYCLPPAFAGGTGAFCIDHGLDYPFGVAAYGWQESLAGGPVALLNQYDQAANAGALARLNWIVATWGSTTDPARATGIGIIAHAVMGDYPGLTVGQLAPVTFRVAGGDPSAIAADTAQMWSESATSSAPYQLTINLVSGPYTVGRISTGTIRVTGNGGGPLVGIPIDFSHSTGVSVIGDQPVRTGADGTVGFHFTPLHTSFRIAASTPVSLPGPQLAAWTPLGAWVATQRVVTHGPPVAAMGGLSLTAQALGQVTLVKMSGDAALKVGSGFRFVIERQSAANVWKPVAVRSTVSNGTMAPITSLLGGSYQVVEQATPSAFLPTGPRRFLLSAGQRAVWTITDRARPVPLQIVKTGDNPIVQPIGAGVAFTVTPDPVTSAVAQSAPVAKTAVSLRSTRSRTTTPSPKGPPRSVIATIAPIGTLVTTADGRTAPLPVPPGRYLLTEASPPRGYRAASPIVVEVPAAVTTEPTAVTVDVHDVAIRGSIVLRKADARTGVLVSGADLRITADTTSSRPRVLGTWRSGATPITVGSLLAGTYTVTEVRPPPGYLLSQLPAERVILGAGETLEVTFADSLIPAPAVPPATAPATTAPAPTTPATTRPPATTVAATTTTVRSPTTVPFTAPATAPAAAAATGALAFTGSPTLRLVGWALVALGTGIGLVGLARGRRNPAQ